MLALIAEGVDDVTKYGFDLDDSLLKKLKYFIDTMVMELDCDHVVFRNDIITFMGSNYYNIKYKKVVDYLESVNFVSAHKRAVWTHNRRDFFSVLKRKLHLN